MSEVINWICLLSITFLVLEVMVYLCKDILKVCNEGKINRTKMTNKLVKKQVNYSCENKIAK